MHEAEQYAEQDKKNKEAVEVRNSAEQLVFQSEKALTDLGDKLSADEKAGVQAEIEKVKEALKGTDSDMIKAATEGLSQEVLRSGRQDLLSSRRRRATRTWAASRAQAHRAARRATS